MNSNLAIAKAVIEYELNNLRAQIVHLEQFIVKMPERKIEFEQYILDIQFKINEDEAELDKISQLER